MIIDIQKNIFNLQKQIRAAEKKWGRENNSVLLLAASKGQSIEKIQEAISAGQTIFGENYLQEAILKINALENQQNKNHNYKNIEWHFIGPIQRNKTKKISEYFHWVHSVDNIVVAERLNNQRPAHLPPLNICLEVNINAEKSKSGVNIDSIFALAEHCRTLPNLRLRGLMTLPAVDNNFQKQRESFKKLADLFKILRNKDFMLDTLSMGMSNDWEAAIAEGATMIRIGTGIFGIRR